MSTTTLSYRISKSNTFSLRGIKIHWGLLYLFFATLFLMMLVLYIVRVDQLTKGAYLIKNYQKEITSLTTQNDDLQAHFAESGFLASVQQKAQGLHFQKTTQVTYVQILQSSLAEAK